MKYIQVNLLIIGLLTLMLQSCVNSDGTELETSVTSQISLNKQYKETIDLLNKENDYDPESLKYRFVGEGHVSLVAETISEADRSESYVLLRYLGSRGKEENVEVYFKLGVENYNLDSEMEAELAFLDDRVVIRSVENDETYHFVLNGSEKNLALAEGQNKINLAYIIIYSENPRSGDNTRSSSSCYCSCVSTQPEGPQRQMCVCDAPSCDAYCVALCDFRRYRKAVCYNNCIIE